MNIHLDNGRKLKIEFGLYDQDDISLKNLMRVYLDDSNMYWSGFFPLDLDGEAPLQQPQYTLFSHININVRDSYRIAEKLLIYVDDLLDGILKNPVIEKNQPKECFVSLLDAQQKAVLAAMLYRSKLNGGYSAVIGTRPFLTLEELIFLENCLVLSSYLKSLNKLMISVKEFSIPVRFAYREILNKRLKFESLMDLNLNVLMHIYNDLEHL